jgi:DNA-directed RNA polymerase subunit RPC12/RpoP
MLYVQTNNFIFNSKILILYSKSNRVSGSFRLPRNHKINNHLTITAQKTASSTTSTTMDESTPYSCSRCDRKYRHMKTLNRHLRHECGKGKLFACTLCSHQTQRSDRLLNHIRTRHPGMQPDVPTKKRRQS